MDIFKPTTFTWWQLGMLKWAVFLVGVAAGATWSEYITPITVLVFLAIGLILSGYLTIVWMRSH